MKRGVIILVVAVALGLCMFLCTRLMFSSAGLSAKAMPTENHSRLPELHWLKNWLRLDPEQMRKVEALHLEYLPKCEALCQRVRLSDEGILALSSRTSTVDATMRTAIEERAKLAVECQQALLQHVHQTAACLRPDQSQKYLALMVPYTLGIPPTEAASNR